MIFGHPYQADAFSISVDFYGDFRFFFKPPPRVLMVSATIRLSGDSRREFDTAGRTRPSIGLEHAAGRPRHTKDLAAPPGRALPTGGAAQACAIARRGLGTRLQE